MPDEVPSRITEDDRGIAVKRLQEAFVDGHISHEELDERLQAVLTAKTHRDLGPALASLPDTNVDRVLRLAAKSGPIRRRGMAGTPSRESRVQATEGEPRPVSGDHRVPGSRH